MHPARVLVVALTAVLVAGAALVLLRDAAPPIATEEAQALGERLRSAVDEDTVLAHLEELSSIAQANDGNRASGTPGYDVSADYVVAQLEAAGYEIERPTFTFDAFEETTPTEMARLVPRRLSFTRNEDFKIMFFSVGGTVRGRMIPVGERSGNGCSQVDFQGFEEGAIALVRRGDCFFREQAANAERAGAAAVIVRPLPSHAGGGVLRGTLGNRSGVGIPVVATTFELGRSLRRDARSGAVVVEIRAETAVKERATENIIAETRASTSPVVMIGAHLDSVPDGPGINDNGSGVAIVLETARALAEVDPAHRFRFAFWGAEEYGLLGSFDYVGSLSERERDEIEAYLNFDMAASPNFIRTVYSAESEPEGSDAIETLLRSYFEERDQDIGTVELQGRSDHAPFARVGIPVGGLFTGADGVKTAREEERFGGRAGVAHDPCYHLECDGLENIERGVLAEMLRALAYAAGVLADTPVGNLGR